MGGYGAVAVNAVVRGAATLFADILGWWGARN